MQAWQFNDKLIPFIDFHPNNVSVKVIIGENGSGKVLY